MAYQQDFIQLTWGGSYFVDDIFINGLHIIDKVTVGPLVSQVFSAEVLQAIADDILRMHSDSAQGNSNNASIEWVKMAIVGTDGKYVTDPILLDTVATSGGRIEPNMYPQLATAVSLRTAKRRGPAAYGRYYAPVALPINADGRINAAAATGYLNWTQQMLTRINATLASNTVGNSIVLGNVSKVGSGSQEEITEVHLGNLTDTQRRRRNKLNETYIGVTI